MYHDDGLIDSLSGQHQGIGVAANLVAAKELLKRKRRNDTILQPSSRYGAPTPLQQSMIDLRLPRVFAVYMPYTFIFDAAGKHGRFTIQSLAVNALNTTTAVDV
jgi:hypothetical protein